MEVTAVLLSRVLGFFETAELTPYGGFFFPDVVKELVQHCAFQKFPATFDEWNSNDGAQFFTGKWEKTVIDKLVVYNNGIQVETRAGTEESRRIIEGLLGWGQEKLGIAYGPKTVREWAYVNDLVFHSDVPLLVTGPLERLSQAVTGELSRILKEQLVYEPTGVNVGHDQLLRKYGRASFSIQRRAEVPLTSNKYFSEAPLPTTTHIALLEQYERDVAEMLNPRLLASRSEQRLG